MVDEGNSWKRSREWDLTTMSARELRDALAGLSEREEEATRSLEALRGRMNLVRAELAGRGIATAPVEDLASVLLGMMGERRP